MFERLTLKNKGLEAEEEFKERSYIQLDAFSAF